MPSGPFHLLRWIEDHRTELKPPVGNKLLWENREFIVMAVGGPNSRADYHINEGEEFFYQVEGDMILRTREKNRIVDIPINEGEVYLLPKRVPHSPQRPAGSVGIVVERQRLPDEKDGFVWFCDSCDAKVHEHFFHLTNIETQLKEIFMDFFADPQKSTCSQCGHRMEKHKV